MGAAKTVTLLLRDWRSGDQAALDELLPLVYAELHKLASRHMRGERANHTLHATDLVSEAYLRLADAGHQEWNDRVHFFAIAARTMRQILVDHARKRNAGKRGDGERPVTFDENAAAAERPENLLALDEALTALAKLDDRRARVLELTYFAGMKQDEIAAAIDIAVSTVARDLRFAEAWLCSYMREERDA